jgi:hypothetical protein
MGSLVFCVGLVGCTPLATSSAGRVTNTTNGGQMLFSPDLPELETSVGRMFFPTLAHREEACGRGYASASGAGDDTGSIQIDTLTGPILFQSVYLTIYNSCRNAALDLNPQPTGLPLLPVLVQLYETSLPLDIYTLSAMRKYSAAFVFFAADGQELGRLEPNSLELLGQGGGTTNPYRQLLSYDPTTFTAAHIRVVEGAASLRLVVNRGKGLETYDLNPVP